MDAISRAMTTNKVKKIVGVTPGGNTLSVFTAMALFVVVLLMTDIGGQERCFGFACSHKVSSSRFRCWPGILTVFLQKPFRQQSRRDREVGQREVGTIRLD